MASEIDICNLALSHLGQNRQITSISPPDGSVEAALCARYYPIARDIILEGYAWPFATRRVGLALSGTAPEPWVYSYAWPNGALTLQGVFLTDDDVPQEYAIESTSAEGTLIYTNVEDAQVKYTARVTDTTKFSKLMEMAISTLLSSFLAGPTIKGKAGQEVAKAQRAEALMWEGKARLKAAQEQKEQVKSAPGYSTGRVESPSRRSRY